MSKEEKPEIIIDAVLTKKAALLVLAGKDSILGLSKELGLSRWATKKLVDSQEFKAHLTNLSEAELLPLVQEMRQSIGKLGKKALQVLENHLDDNNLEAVKLVLKTMGLMENEVKQADTTLNVILPGSTEKVIEVESDT
jgi:hypothetical protein